MCRNGSINFKTRLLRHNHFLIILKGAKVVALNIKFKCKKGQALILLPLILVVLIGIAAIVIDVGMLYVEKIELQNAVDAAALAGGQKLPANPSEAITTANNYAAENGKSGDVVTPTVTNDNHVLTVNSRRHAPLYFARIFGMTTSDITATASVTVSTVGSVYRAIPLGVEKQTFVYGQPYTLKAGGGDGHTGNYGALAIGGTGADVFRDNIKNGCSVVLTVSQWVDTEPGNMSGPTDESINYLINQDSTAIFATVKKGSPRIVVIPIMESMNVNGRADVQIAGFAVFFLESSDKGDVTGNFMQMIVRNSTSGLGTNYGAYNLKLTN